MPPLSRNVKKYIYIYNSVYTYKYKKLYIEKRIKIKYINQIYTGCL